MYKSIFFFFQAEDGIRDYKVTGVQTCALPISCHAEPTSYTKMCVVPLLIRQRQLPKILNIGELNFQLIYIQF